jgi:hypothetical protein
VTLALACAAIAPLQSVWAGNEGSGGGDTHKAEYGSAWFLGARTIRYCDVVSPTFGMRAAEIEPVIENAFATWRAYLRKGKISDHDPAEQRLLLNHARMPACDGSEDLKFYFGVSDAETDRAKQAEFENPVAFSHRRTYDMRSGWGDGFVWVAPQASVPAYSSLPDWRVPNALNGILLHEMGHILGCEHASGTIMDEGIAYLTGQGYNAPNLQHRLTHIDWTRTLRFFDTAPIHAPALVSDQAFEKMTGHKPVGKAKARVDVDFKQGRMSVVFSDDASKLTVPFNPYLREAGPGETGDQPGAGMGYSVFVSLFKRAWVETYPGGASPSGSRGAHLMGGAYIGELRAASGTTYVATFNVNMNDDDRGPLTIYYIDHGVQRVLVQAQEI